MVYDVLSSRNRPYSSLPEEFRTWSPDSLHKREAELKAKAQTLTAEYVQVERAIDNLPERKRHPQPTAPLSVGSGPGVVQQEPPPARRRGWLRRLFSRQ